LRNFAITFDTLFIINLYMYIYLKPGISKKEILKKYNSNNLLNKESEN